MPEPKDQDESAAENFIKTDRKLYRLVLLAHTIVFFHFGLAITAAFSTFSELSEPHTFVGGNLYIPKPPLEIVFALAIYFGLALVAAAAHGLFRIFPQSGTGSLGETEPGIRAVIASISPTLGQMRLRWVTGVGTFVRGNTLYLAEEVYKTLYQMSRHVDAERTDAKTDIGQIQDVRETLHHELYHCLIGENGLVGLVYFFVVANAAATGFALLILSTYGLNTDTAIHFIALFGGIVIVGVLVLRLGLSRLNFFTELRADIYARVIRGQATPLAGGGTPDGGVRVETPEDHILAPRHPPAEERANNIARAVRGRPSTTRLHQFWLALLVSWITVGAFSTTSLVSLQTESVDLRYLGILLIILFLVVAALSGSGLARLIEPHEMSRRQIAVYGVFYPFAPFLFTLAILVFSLPLPDLDSAVWLVAAFVTGPLLYGRSAWRLFLGKSR